MKIKNNKGVVGVDIAVAIVILITFVGIIVGMFSNLAVTSRRVERKTVATKLAVEVIEGIKTIEFAQIPYPSMTVDQVNSLSGKSIAVQNGYSVNISIDNTTYENLIKIVKVEVIFKDGNNSEKVVLETLIKNE